MFYIKIYLSNIILSFNYKYKIKIKLKKINKYIFFIYNNLK